MRHDIRPRLLFLIPLAVWLLAVVLSGKLVGYAVSVQDAGLAAVSILVMAFSMFGAFWCYQLLVEALRRK